jgi:hypothetical protein
MGLLSDVLDRPAANTFPEVGDAGTDAAPGPKKTYDRKPPIPVGSEPGDAPPGLNSELDSKAATRLMLEQSARYSKRLVARVKERCSQPPALQSETLLGLIDAGARFDRGQGGRTVVSVFVGLPGELSQSPLQDAKAEVHRKLEAVRVAFVHDPSYVRFATFAAKLDEAKAGHAEALADADKALAEINAVLADNKSPIAAERAHTKAVENAATLQRRVAALEGLATDARREAEHVLAAKLEAAREELLAEAVDAKAKAAEPIAEAVRANFVAYAVARDSEATLQPSGGRFRSVCQNYLTLPEPQTEI